MSGTPIVSEWHHVSFRVPIVCLFHHIFHIFSKVPSATGQAKVMRSVDDSQVSQGSAKCMFCPWVLSSDGSNQTKSKQRQMKTRIPMVIKGHATYIEWCHHLSVRGPVREHDISIQSWGDTIYQYTSTRIDLLNT